MARGLAICLLLFLFSAAAYPQTSSGWFPYLGLKTDGQLVVQETVAGSPSQRGGLRRGDKIISIDGKTTVGLPQAALFESLRGELGSTVILKVERRGASVLEVSLVRAPLPGQPSPEPPKPSGNDGSLVITTTGRGYSPQAYAYVSQALAWLPRATKLRLQAGGVTLALVLTRKDVTGEEGGSCYDTAHRQAIVCEHSDQSTVTGEIDSRLPITTLHELGHAYDHVLNYFSRTPEYLASYDKEAPRVKEQDKEILSHFLQPGRMGPSECFASLFACKYFQGKDRRLQALKANFPETFRIVQNIRD